ncbi:YhcN/YlaJ family sporulation lipoprotein [Fictibacillus phosphorivorans]|uniref:YhcN/YlaJ family sporulation lipoprotein n=1 Tax=Fictibacillus phosphorivorans TaxID=1221500 RepID=UPI00203C1854|nr:YhcN/YlaJ family sporulation lipoprotein [Fictibacillus phosphorivorans]MCM3717072.1 YhcN/YlaJ family sporulation lipoprotein [Fictibacillus phosphorivorans]MCM3774759.1 YhcN/YlaJ family sporulation lipoprotein [Fictibacillus phosphorivorans]
MRKLLLMVIICTCTILSACSGKSGSGDETLDTKQVKYDTSEKKPNSQIDSPRVAKHSDEVHQSRDLVELAESVDGVEKAYVIVSGDYTLVGIVSSEPTAPGEENDPLRKEVYNVLKGNAHGRNAAITTDPEKIKKIKELGLKADQSNKQSQSDVFNEMGVLIGKIKPIKGQKKSTRRQDMHEENNQRRNDLYE